MPFFAMKTRLILSYWNHFTFANRKICTGTIETKVLLNIGWFYKLITL